MIVIKVMEEMPKCCHWDCPLCNEDGGACMLGAYDTKTDTKKERAKDCLLGEIVTCKDCKHCYPDEDGRGYHCERDSNVRFSVHGNFWCADGERRE